jgi:2-polyprenyl-3-methyl-5-hydroxy-6-metoxy-1,4-benzoquinol methylase
MEDSERKEFYSISDAEAQRTYVGVRRAKDWVGFLLPHLKKGFSLLDCGCGVGSITLDLAELVAPGQVIGVDMDEGQLEIGRTKAKERGLTNITFEHGNVYQLCFDSGTFDAALAHTLLYHLSDPILKNLAIGQGWTTQTEMDEIISWMREWGERPDAFMAIMYCAALGWKA